MKEDITSVQKHLESLQETQPEQAVEVARLVDRKSGEFQAILNDTGKHNIQGVSPEVTEAKNLVTDASVNAVAVLVATQHDGAVQITADMVKERVGEKIANAPATSPEAKEALGEAKEALAHNDLTGAISKVVEVNKIERAAESASGTAHAVPALTAPPATTGASVTLPLIGQITVPLINQPLPDQNVSSTPR